MKINKVLIENYRSIIKMEFVPNPGINAFIGPNSAGKSNVFDAINLMLGPAYPSANSITKEDRCMGDPNKKVRIKLDFSDGNNLELKEEIWGTRNRLTLKCNGNMCNSETREQYCSAYLGVDREILDYLPSNRWSLVGRILQQINERFLKERVRVKEKEGNNFKVVFKKDVLIERLKKIRDELLFSVKDDSGQKNLMETFLRIIQEETAKQLNRPLEDFKIDLTLYDPWNFYKTLQLLVNEKDTNMQFQASSLGMGVQASISIAILKAYSEMNLANKSPIFIDEPELFLHPQAQRNFYNILNELSQDKINAETRKIISPGTQVFYNTHSPNFLSAGKFNQIFIIRKDKDQGTFIKTGDPARFIYDLEARTGIKSDQENLLLHYRNAYDNTGDAQRANEAFFAKKIILVEGQSEVLVLPYLFNLLGFDDAKSGISIVRCGGKSELDRFYRLYSEFGIPCFVIFDGDKQLDTRPKTERDANIKKNKAILFLFGEDSKDYPDNQVKKSYLGFEYELENNLGFETTKTGIELFVEVKEKISDGKSVPVWVKKVLEAVSTLPDQTKSILREKPEESVF